MIPKIIHQTWKDEHLPAHLNTFRNSWLDHHPGWTHRLWTDQDLRALVKEHYRWFLSVYDAYDEPIKKVDAARYFIMHQVGGLYVDLDFECLSPVDSILEEHGLVLALEPESHTALKLAKERALGYIVCNAFMASDPRDPFWEHVFKLLQTNHSCPGTLDATGPFFLTRAYDAYPGKDQIELLPSSLIYPVDKIEAWNGKLKDAKERKRIEATAVAVHHWEGMWFRNKEEGGEKSAHDEVPINLLFHRRIVLTSRLRRSVFKNCLEPSFQAPTVSCVMITRGKLELARCAVRCFLDQSYEHRELIIVEDGEGSDLQDYVASLASAKITYVKLCSEGKTLGELRNIGIGHAQGEYIAQWDDDDLSDACRLEAQMLGILAMEAGASFLQRHLLWWPDRKRMAFSRPRIWEGSMVAHRTTLCPYAHVRRGEDTPVVAHVAKHARVALVDVPSLYVYICHGHNTFVQEHFEEHWAKASARFKGADYDYLYAQLVSRLPLDAYARGCSV